MTLYDDVNRYEVGDLVRVAAPFRDEDGTPIDPSVVRFIYKNPQNAIIILTYAVDTAVVRDNAGDYHVDIDTNLSGLWAWRWEATGAGQAVDEGQFYVKPTLI